MSPLSLGRVGANCPGRGERLKHWGAGERQPILVGLGRAPGPPLPSGSSKLVMSWRSVTGVALQRPSQPERGDDERALLLGWLAFHRGALEAKCSDLTPEQLSAHAVTPSRLSLLGLVRHMTEMERVFLSLSLTGRPVDLLYCTDEDPDGDFESIDPQHAKVDLARWRSECKTADEAIVQIGTTDAHPPGRESTLRWHLQKVIGEYARHNGHADLIREATDGQTGE